MIYRTYEAWRNDYDEVLFYAMIVGGMIIGMVLSDIFSYMALL